MNKIFLLIIISALLYYSCETTKNVFGNKIKSFTVSELNNKIQENKFIFHTFSGRAKLHVTMPGMDQNVAAQIEMVNDSIIGMSFRLFAIEGARVLITPDSIKILDRLNEKYIAHDFSFLKSQFDLALNFNDLQNLIAGNTIYYDTTKLAQEVSDDKYILFSQDSVYKNTLWLSPDFEMMRMFIEELKNNRSMILSYSNYDKIEGEPFAFNRTILINAQNTFSAEIEYTKVIINEPYVFPFTVNPKYEKGE